MIEVHWTHKAKMAKFYREGFTREELSIMYKLPYWYIKELTKMITQVERI